MKKVFLGAILFLFLILQTSYTSFPFYYQLPAVFAAGSIQLTLDPAGPVDPKTPVTITATFDKPCQSGTADFYWSHSYNLDFSATGLSSLGVLINNKALGTQWQGQTGVAITGNKASITKNDFTLFADKDTTWGIIAFCHGGDKQTNPFGAADTGTAQLLVQDSGKIVACPVCPDNTHLDTNDKTKCINANGSSTKPLKVDKCAAKECTEKGCSTTATEEVPPPPPPCKERAADGSCRVLDTAIGDFTLSDQGFVTKLLSILLSIGGAAAVLIIMLAGYRLITSQGDPEKVKSAKELLTSAIVGLLFIIFSLVILTVIGVNILHIPGFSV